MAVHKTPALTALHKSLNKLNAQCHTVGSAFTLKSDPVNSVESYEAFETIQVFYIRMLLKIGRPKEKQKNKKPESAFEWVTVLDASRANLSVLRYAVGLSQLMDPQQNQKWLIT